MPSAALEARQPAPRAQQRVLERVLGILERAEHPVAVGVKLAAVGLDQAAERVLVALARSFEQLTLSGLRGGRGGAHAPVRLDPERGLGRPYRQATFTHWAGLPLRLALLPPPSATPATAWMP